MSDNKLRCVLAYRLGAEPVVLAKYDYASQYESHGGSSGDAGTLYGGRDKNYADAVALVIGSNPPGQVNESNKLGGFKCVQSESHQVCFGADNEGICKYFPMSLEYSVLYFEIIRGVSHSCVVVIAFLHLLYNRPCCDRWTEIPITGCNPASCGSLRPVFTEVWTSSKGRNQ